MSLVNLSCKRCTDNDASHPCWVHSKSQTGCRLIQNKWAPTRCGDCINAIAKMAVGSPADKRAAFEAYSAFLKGLASFVERVSAFDI